MIFSVKDIKKLVRNLFFEYESNCFSCKKKLAGERELQSGICGSCRENLVEFNSHRLVSQTPHMIVHTTSFYNSFLKKHFTDYKFAGASYKEKLFIDMLMRLVNNLDYAKRVSWITYIPMRRRRELLRTYNPAKELARTIAKNNGLVMVDLLEKIKETKEQNKLRAKQRLDNVRDSYSIKSKLRAKIWKNNKLIHKEIHLDQIRKYPGIVVDDLITTGATMREVLLTIYKAGIYAEGVCLARADYPKEGVKEEF